MANKNNENKNSGHFLRRNWNQYAKIAQVIIMILR